jgi:hypothetical protein
VVNPKGGTSIVKPYQLTLKYSNYKKDTNPDAHVKVFNAIVRVNGETFEVTSLIHLVIH